MSISKERNNELARGAWPTVSELAEILEISEEEIYQMVKDGDIAPKNVQLSDMTNGQTNGQIN